MFKYSNNEIVTFDNGVVNGVGEVIGVAQMPNPVIGCGYMIKPISCNRQPNEEYPFDCFVVFECHMQKADK